MPNPAPAGTVQVRIRLPREVLERYHRLIPHYVQQNLHMGEIIKAWVEKQEAAAESKQRNPDRV